MGIFNLFKRKTTSKNTTTDNGVLGPDYLDGLVEHIQNPKNLLQNEWRRKLKAASGQTQFKIKYYGQQNKDYKNLIVGSNYAPMLIFAVDIKTEQELLLFDGCKHGYNAMFCDTFKEEEVKNRPTKQYYTDKADEDVFEVIISTHYHINYIDEFSEEVDESGLIELIDGGKVSFESVIRNGYSLLQILVVNNKGETIEIVSEELS